MASYTDTSTDDATISASLLTRITTPVNDTAASSTAILTLVTTVTVDAATVDDSTPNVIENITTDAATIFATPLQAITPSTTITDKAGSHSALTTRISTQAADAATGQSSVSQALPGNVSTDAATIAATLAEGQTVTTTTTDAATISGALIAGVTDLLQDAATVAAVPTASTVVAVPTTDAAVFSTSIVTSSHISTVAASAGRFSTRLFDALLAVNVSLDVAAAISRALEPLSGRAWVAGTDHFNMSRYTNFRFNSIAAIDGRLLALADDGAYLLDGDDDGGQPITASTLGDITDNVDGQQGPTPDPRARRPAYLYLSYAASGPVKFVLWETGDGQEARHEFDLPPRAAIDTIGGRGQLDAGIEARFFRFGFENVGGSRFDINEGRVQFNMLQRRA